MSCINFQHMYTYTYQKNITSYAFLLVFKIVESLQRILKNFRILKSKEDGNKICFYRQLLTKHLAKNKKIKQNWKRSESFCICSYLSFDHCWFAMLCYIKPKK